MKRLALSLLLVLGTGFLALFQQGCGTVHWVVVAAPTPTPSLPNVSRIELRMGNQQNRITNAVQMGNLDEAVADGLAQNIGTVQQWERAYLQSKEGPYEDLTLAETRWLDRMLDNNSLAIDDAIRRNQAWVRIFRGETVYHYDFNSEADQRMFTAYMHYRLKAQRQRINEYEQSGELSAAQCDALRRKADAMDEMEKGYYRKNGKMGFSRTQIRQMKESLEKDSKDFKQLEIKHGRPAPLPTPTPEPLFRTEHSNNQNDLNKDNPRDRHGKKDRWNSKKWEDPTPTPTTLFKQDEKLESQDRDGTNKNDRWNNRNNGRKNKKGFSHRDDRENSDLGTEVSPSTPVPESQVKPAETDKKGGLNRDREELNKNDRFKRPRRDKKDKKGTPKPTVSEKSVEEKPAASPVSEDMKNEKGDDSGKSKHEEKDKPEKKGSGDSQGQDKPKDHE